LALRALAADQAAGEEGGADRDRGARTGRGWGLGIF